MGVEGGVMLGRQWALMCKLISANQKRIAVCVVNQSKDLLRHIDNSTYNFCIFVVCKKVNYYNNV